MRRRTEERWGFAYPKRAPSLRPIVLTLKPGTPLGKALKKANGRGIRAGKGFHIPSNIPTPDHLGSPESRPPGEPPNHLSSPNLFVNHLSQFGNHLSSPSPGTQGTRLAQKVSSKEGVLSLQGVVSCSRALQDLCPDVVVFLVVLRYWRSELAGDPPLPMGDLY